MGKATVGHWKFIRPKGKIFSSACGKNIFWINVTRGIEITVKFICISVEIYATYSIVPITVERHKLDVTGLLKSIHVE